jgi:hypothetical protein
LKILDVHHVGAVAHPGNGPISILQPVGEVILDQAELGDRLELGDELLARQGVDLGFGEVNCGVAGTLPGSSPPDG